ncbi:MAG: HlyD family efflux transporter periplasmic adaptor subunit, partial [Christensenellales bacterium]
AEQEAKLALALSQTTGYDYESFNEAFGSKAAEQVQATAASLAEDLSGLGINTVSGGDITEEQIELAEIAVRRLENLVSKMSIKSEIEGTVIAVNINKGEVLSPGLPAMVIADTNKTVITGYVYEKDVGSLEAGMDVSIITGNTKYKGSIKRIGVAAMDIGGSSSAFDMMTKIEIEPDRSFKKMLGAAVDLKVVLSGKKDILAVPLDCLTSDGCVFVLGEDDIAYRRAIVTGFEDAFYVEVLGGLAAGDRIVASPKNVQEGQKLNYDRSK